MKTAFIRPGDRERPDLQWEDGTRFHNRLFLVLKARPSNVSVYITGKVMRPRVFNWQISRETYESDQRVVLLCGKARSVDEAKSAIDLAWPAVLALYAERERKWAALRLQSAEEIEAYAAELRRDA